MDEQTMKDYIEDLLIERAQLYERVNILTVQNEHLAKENHRLERLAVSE